MDKIKIIYPLVYQSLAEGQKSQPAGLAKDLARKTNFLLVTIKNNELASCTDKVTFGSKGIFDFIDFPLVRYCCWFLTITSKKFVATRRILC